MNLQILAAYDIKARAFMMPFYASHIDVGLRAFQEAARTPDHQIHNNPADFQLFHVGMWCDEDSSFELLPKPQFLAVASQFAKPNGADHVRS